MIHTLIVDDEDLLRKGLIAMFDWQALGFQVTGEVSNGREATEFIENNPVDLVISDIRMPIVSGIDLMRSVREKKKDIKFIILSGYDDFSYAQSALKYGAVSYVLKPFEEEEMIAELMKVKNDIEQSTREERERTALKATALDAFLLMLLNNKVDKELFESNISRLPINFICKEYQVIVLEYDQKNILNSSVAETLIKSLISIFKSNNQGEALFQTSEFNKSVCEIIYMLNGRACIDSADDLILRLQTLLDDFEISKYNIGVGLEVAEFEKVPQSYREAKGALDFKISYGNKSVIYYKNLQKLKKSSYHYPRDLELEIFEELRLETPQRLELYIDDFFEYVKNSAASIITIRQSAFELISSYKHQNGIEDNDLDLSEINSHITNCDDVNDIKEYLALIFISCLSGTNAESCNQSRKLIDDVKTYVTNHYSEKITLKEISRVFFISKSYFCRIFKEYTGMNFYHYLNYLRVEKAKFLLKNSYYKNYEICEMIGFENSSYFNQLFRKVTGMTPGEYRDVVIKNTCATLVSAM